MTTPTFPPRYSPGERRRVLLFAAFVMLLFTLPYAVNLTRQTELARFGGFMFGVEDGNSYLAKMRQGATGDGLYRLAFTHEPQGGSLLFAPYLLGGKIAALFASPEDPRFVDAMLLVFHAARMLFGAGLVVVMHRLVAAFIEDQAGRWLALALVTLGGGLGWLLILLGKGWWLGAEPVDFLLPEGYTFYLLYGLPHLALARIGLLGGLLILFHALNAEGWRSWLPRMIAAGLCWLVMALCVPFYVAVLAAILGVWGLAALIRKRRFPIRLFVRCAIGASLPALWFGYNLIVLNSSPALRALQSQNILPSPHPLHYVFGYGVLAVLALRAFAWAWRRGQSEIIYLLPVAWLTAAPALAYAPVEVQRRLLEGVFVPLCILAVIGLRLWLTRNTVRRLVTAGVLFACLLTPALLLVGGMAGQNPALFRAWDEISALDWLNEQAAPGSVVLANVATSNYVPARADVRTYIGHGVETAGSWQKEQIAHRFFSGQSDAAEQHALLELADYVIAGPDDTLPDESGLTLVWQSGRYRIYTVTR